MVRKILKQPDWRVALIVTVIMRVFYSAAAAVFFFFLHPNAAQINTNELTDGLPAPGGLFYLLFGIWDRFDTLWFLRIAQHGYDRPMAVIFYPLFPATIRLLTSLTSIAPVVAALLISTIGTFFFLTGLLRLAADQLTGDGKWRLTLLVTVWPTSFILFAGYADSLTCALVVWSIVFARENRWPLATLLAVMAGVSRPSGVLVSLPLFLMAVRSKRLTSLIVIATPMGTLAYWAWLRFSGRMSVIAAYGKHQQMTIAPPWITLREIFRLVMSEGDTLLAIKVALLIFVFFLLMRRGVRIEDRLFGIAVILQMLMYSGRPLLGAARYLILVYPAFVVIGAYAHNRWTWAKFAAYFFAFAFLNLMWMRSFLEWSLVL